MAVWLYTPPVSQKIKKVYGKFKRPWIGPCRITAVRAHNSRDLISTDNRRFLNVHTSRRKKFFPHRAIPTQDPAIASQEYVVPDSYDMPHVRAPLHLHNMHSTWLNEGLNKFIP
ncbi:hypothetical protein BGX26_004451 [Mortierella sp. AD094]|nr:hypothetical protein BGX26_004451 [Mortierella sp. AD094]